MMWLRRIGLFILINMLVVFTISIIVNLLGIQPYLTSRGMDYVSLMELCLVWGFGGAFISLFLSRWIAKRMMGVQVIDPENPSNNQERWLVQTVHQLAEKAGINKMPEVGIFESPAPNAFATGASRNSSLVAVSTGLFNSMNQDEMEAVLGHELTHVVNGDMVTMTLLQGVINAFVMFLARVVAYAIERGGSNDNRRGGGMMEFLMIQMLQFVFGIIGMIPLMAFSRWREFRADAGGAKLAGKAKMINALKALKAFQEQPQMQGLPQPAPAMRAMQISSHDGFALFASHPSLDVRIERLENSTEA